MNNKIVVYLVLAVVLAGLAFWAIKGGVFTSAPDLRKDETGWYTSATECIAAAGEGPRLIAVMRAGWGRYERATFEHEQIAALISGMPRCRMDWSQDTALMKKWEITEAPALIIVAKNGEVISKLLGMRDLTVVKRTIQRSIEVPVPMGELASRTDDASILRYAELCIDLGRFDTAAAVTSKFVADDTTPLFAKGQYLHAYAIAEMGKIEDAGREIKQYLDRYPTGDDRTPLLWILTVLDLQKNKEADGVAKIRTMVKTDSSSPFSRQAVLSYTMEYLIRGKKKLDAADKFISEAIAESTPWTDDFLLARAMIRLNSPIDPSFGMKDMIAVARGAGAQAEDAQDRLMMLAMPPEGTQILPEIILTFQDLSRTAVKKDYARFVLARLYLMNNDLERAKEEVRTLAALDNAVSDDAKLLEGLIKLEVDKTPADAVGIFAEAVRKYPDRESYWAAKYGLARSLFFSGNIPEAKKEIADVLAYLKGRMYLGEAFLIVLPQPMRPMELAEQFEDFRSKLSDVEKEEGGAAVFTALLDGVLLSSKGDTGPALAKFEEIITKNPTSSLADDAYFEIAKIHIRSGDLEKAKDALTKLTTLYQHSDQADAARQFLQLFEANQQRRGR